MYDVHWTVNSIFQRYCSFISSLDFICIWIIIFPDPLLLLTVYKLSKSIRSYALSNKAFPGRGSIKNFASCFFWSSIQGCFTGGIWFPCRWLSCSKYRINKNFVLKLLLKFGKLLTLTSFCVKSMFFYSFCTRAYQNGLIERKNVLEVACNFSYTKIL